MILWGFQVLLIIGFAWYYGRTADPSIFGLQSTVLTFYRVPFLHGLLPMADWAPWVRNIACILALGFAAAYPATDEGQGRNALALAGSLTVVAAWTFPAAMDSRMVIAGVIGSIAAAVTYAVQEPTYGGGGEA